jgi:hypothetical protein
MIVTVPPALVGALVSTARVGGIAVRFVESRHVDQQAATA